MTRSLAVGALGLAALALGCGGSDDGSPVTPAIDAAPSPSDAGSSMNDAQPGCEPNVTLTPGMPTAGPGLTVIARSEPVGAMGLPTYRWTVALNDVPILFRPLTENQSRIEFPIETAGRYGVTLDLGGSCQSYYRELNVQALGANSRVMRLRLVPPPGGPAPPQERIVSVTGGQNEQTIGEVLLDPGQVYALAVRGPDAVPVAAYLRFVSRGTPDSSVEAFSTEAGAAAVRLIAGQYDVLVVPTSAALAPRVVTGFDPFDRTLTVDGGQVLTGVVRDGTGAAVAGARVSVTSGGTPSTIAVTAADGRYQLRWRDDPGAPEVMTVVAPPDRALPRLDATLDLAGHATIDAGYAAIATRDLAGTIVRVGGAPAVATEVVVSATVAVAATLADGATTVATVPGRYRREVRTDATGALPALRIARVPGLLFAAHGSGAVDAADLGAATSFAPTTTTATGRVVRSDGAAAPGATIRAVLIGELAFAGAPVATAIAGSDGRFSLAIAAGAPYRLVALDPTGAHAELGLAVAASTTPIALGDLRLTATIAVSGTLVTAGQTGGRRAVGIAALCHLDCAGLDRVRPLANAVTDTGGKFVLGVPDPGIAPGGARRVSGRVAAP